MVLILDALASLGFGFIEVGTVTPRRNRAIPSRACSAARGAGHHQPHGFQQPWRGYPHRKCEACEVPGILGINIGKNFDTPIEKAAGDYLVCLRKAYTHASYIAINISSPNTKTCVNCRGRLNSMHCWNS